MLQSLECFTQYVEVGRELEVIKFMHQPNSKVMISNRTGAQNETSRYAKADRGRFQIALTAST